MGDLQDDTYKPNVREMIEKFNKIPIRSPENILPNKCGHQEPPDDESNAPQIESSSNGVSSASDFSSDEDFSSSEDADTDKPPTGRFLDIPEIDDETKNFLREEENYCSLLEDAIDNYISILETDKFDLYDVFGRIDLIFSYQNGTFLPDLRRSKNVSKIADCFIKHKKLFNTYYESYFKNQQNMIFVMAENKDIFKNKLSDQVYSEREAIFLKAPNERIQSYQAFLKTMRDTLVDHTNVKNFDRALEIIENLTSNFSKKEETVRFVISELVETERIYVEKLEKIIERIIPTIENTVKMKRKLKSIVGAVPEVYVKQMVFYEDLKQCLFAFDPSEVADCFLQHKDDFKLYVKDQQMKNNLAAIDECREILKKEHLKDMDFYAPLNRLYKYKLLLQELRKSCEKGRVAFGRLPEATEMVGKIISEMNGAAAMNCIRDENIYLEEQGKLILRDEFLVQHKTFAYDAMVFLFEKSIVFTEKVMEGSIKSRRDVFVYKGHIVVKHMGLNHNEGSEKSFQVQFHDRSKKDFHTLHAKDKATKDTWIEKLRYLLMAQLTQEKQESSYGWRQTYVQ